MRFYTSILCFLVLLIFSDCKNKDKVENEKVTDESTNVTAEEWIELFNGKNLDDWIIKINKHTLNENIHNTFRVEDGIMKVSYDGGYNDKFDRSFGHIFYKKPFSNYRLKLQYRFVGEQIADGESWATKNSGVMIHSQSPESMLIDQGFPVSIEVQFLGGVEEGVARPTANLCTPGTHVVMNDELITEHCNDSSSETYYGEEWIDVEVVVTSDYISHIINGKEVIKYSKPVFGGDFTPDNDEWKSKEGKPVTEGYIALQSESHPIEFRNIKLLELKD